MTIQSSIFLSKTSGASSYPSFSVRRKKKVNVSAPCCLQETENRRKKGRIDIDVNRYRCVTPSLHIRRDSVKKYKKEEE